MIRAPFGPPPSGAEIEASMLANNDRMTTRLALEAAVRYGNAGDLESSAAAVALLLAVSGLGGAVRVRVVLEVDGASHIPRCYAVDDPAVFVRADDDEGFCSSCFTPWNMGACAEPLDWLRDRAFDAYLPVLARQMRGQGPLVPLSIPWPDDPITTTATTPEACAMVAPT